MASGDARIVVTVDLASGELKKIQDFDKAVEGMGKSSSDAAPKVGAFQDSIDRLTSRFTVGAIAAHAIESAFSAVRQTISDSIKGALGEEESQNRLTAALELTGRARQGSVSGMLAFAQQQARVTTFTHEQVEASATLLAQMTKLDSSGIQQATKGAMGLSTVMGIDLQSATVMVTRAMEGNFQSLRRIGIAVDETLPKEEQVAQVLQKLNDLYPRANAELDTQAGKIKQAGKFWEEFKNKLGATVLAQTGITDSLGFFNRIAPGFESNQDRINRLAVEGREAAMGWASSLVYIHPQLSDMNEAIHRGGTYWEDYKKTTEANDKALQAFRPTVEAAVHAVADFFNLPWNYAGWKTTTAKSLADLKTEFDDISKAIIASREEFEKKWEAPWVDQLKLNEVEAEFKGADAAIDGTSVALDILDGTLQGTVPDWQKLYDKQLQLDHQYKSLAQGMVVWGDANTSVLGTVGKAWGDLTKKIIMNLETQVLAQELATAKLIGLKKDETLANYIASLFDTMPWFIALPLTITAFAAINAIFAKVLKFAGGFEGIVRQPTLFMAGEAGPERVSVRNQAQGLSGGTTTISIGGIYVTGTGGASGEAIWKALQTAARRRGVKVGRA